MTPMIGSQLTEKEILAAVEDWKSWGEKFGWVLIGLGSAQHNEHNEAGFRRAGDRPQWPWGAQFSITRGMREDIDRAMKG